uniref:Uncharacterized protein n=1 Tax=Arundo donax TaxID=35708 RepID=A0A0A9C3L7_ARUDO
MDFASLGSSISTATNWYKFGIIPSMPLDKT